MKLNFLGTTKSTKPKNKTSPKRGEDTSTSPRTSKRIPISSGETPRKGDKETEDEMPSAEVVEARFTMIEKELGLSSAHLTVDKKWQILKQTEENKKSTKTPMEDEAEEVVKILKGRRAVKPDYLRKVRTMLHTKPVSWVRRFVDGSGFDYIFNIFRESLTSSDPAAKDIIAECVRCLKAILNIDSNIFEKIIDTGDYLALITRSVPHLSVITQAEIFELLAVICFSGKEGDFQKGYQQILDGIRKEVKFQFLVETLTTKYPELRINTMLLINGLLWGTDDIEEQAKILSDLELVQFKRIFDAVSKGNKEDELWQKQVEIFHNFEQEQDEKPEAMVIKLKTHIKQLEEDYKIIQNKNSRQAEAIEQYGTLLQEVESLRLQVQQKDGVIQKLIENQGPNRPTLPSDILLPQHWWTSNQSTSLRSTTCTTPWGIPTNIKY